MLFAPALRPLLRTAPAATRSLHLSSPALLPKKNADSTDKAKRPLSPYNLFVKKTFPVIKAENPDLKGTEILKKVAAAWKSSPENPNAQ